MQHPDFVPYKIHPKHYLVHLVSSMATLALCVLADCVILSYVHHEANAVRWNGQRTNEVFQAGPAFPTNGEMWEIEFGIKNDGSIVWRKK